MSRPKGLSKTGGRKVGSLNKRTEDLLHQMEEAGYNPLKSLLAKYNSLSQEDQLKVDLKLMEYVYPKLKEQPLTIECVDRNINDAESQFKSVFEIVNSADPKVKELFGKVDRFEFFQILASLSANGILEQDKNLDQN